MYRYLQYSEQEQNWGHTGTFNPMRYLRSSDRSTGQEFWMTFDNTSQRVFWPLLNCTIVLRLDISCGIEKTPKAVESSSPTRTQTDKNPPQRRKKKSHTMEPSLSVTPNNVSNKNLRPTITFFRVVLAPHLFVETHPSVAKKTQRPRTSVKNKTRNLVQASFPKRNEFHFVRHLS